MNKLYIIHGWTYKIEAWEEVAKILKMEGISAELLKVPGLTKDSKKIWTIEDYVAWADKNIPDGAIALGHSNGGRILLNLAAKNSSKLRGLILLDAAGIYERSLKRSVLRFFSKLFGPLKKVPFLRKAVHRLIGASDYENAPENMKKTLDNMITSDRYLNLSQIDTRTQIIWGSDDKITPLRQGEKMHKLLKNSTLTIKQGWSHSPYFGHKEDLAKEITRAYEALAKSGGLR